MGLSCEIQIFPLIESYLDMKQSDHTEEETICCVCKVDENDEYVMLCDGCDRAFHTYCTKACMCCSKKASQFGKLAEVPEGDFYCKLCAGRPPTAPGTKSIIYAFGCNSAGQLGIGTESDIASTPQLVSELSSLVISQISLGGWNSLVLTEDGEVYSCGDGEHGKTGHSDVVHEHLLHFRLIETLLVQNLTKNSGKISTIACGRDFNYAVSVNGHCYTWGSGDLGQTGHQQNADKKIPTKVSALREAEINLSSSHYHLACGWSHALVVNEAGQLISCGHGKYGQLGTGDFRNQWLPHILTPVPQIAVNAAPLYYNPQNSEPFIIPDGSYSQLAAGKSHSCLLLENGQVYGFGSNVVGQIAAKELDQKEKEDLKSIFRKINMNFSRPTPFVNVRESITQISLGADHTLLLSISGKVYGCGLNRFHQLGLPNELTSDSMNSPSDFNVYTPTLVRINPETKEYVPIRMVATGDYHSLVLSRSGQVYSCGNNKFGQCGFDENQDIISSFTLINSLPSDQNAINIFAGGDSTFIMFSNTSTIEQVSKKKRKPAISEAKKAKKIKS